LLGYAYRSLNEVVTCLELCQRLFVNLPADTTHRLINERNQIARMTHTLVARVRDGAK
jgi:four helix bundle protein